MIKMSFIVSTDLLLHNCCEDEVVPKAKTTRLRLYVVWAWDVLRKVIQEFSEPQKLLLVKH